MRLNHVCQASLMPHRWRCRCSSPPGLCLLGSRFHVSTLARGPAHSQLIQVDPHHGLANVRGHLCQDLGVVVVRDSLHDGLRTLLGVRGLEDAAADKDAVDAQLHAERCIRWRRDATRSEVHDWQLAIALGLLQEVQRSTHLLGQREQLVVIHGLQLSDLLMKGPDVPDGLDYVASACLALRADHAGALGNPAQGLTKISATANKGHLKLVLVHMVVLISHRQNLALVDAIDAEVLEDLRLHKVADAALGHHWDGH
mmetsp:Transcript_10201/g.11372  ORF Transcript_10201/g.11372 Transcript_10201/m.11372 type:complete len:256 (+) Transcript_10201:127-894(+)